MTSLGDLARDVKTVFGSWVKLLSLGKDIIISMSNQPNEKYNCWVYFVRRLRLTREIKCVRAYHPQFQTIFPTSICLSEGYSRQSNIQLDEQFYALILHLVRPPKIFRLPSSQVFGCFGYYCRQENVLWKINGCHQRIGRKNDEKRKSTILVGRWWIGLICQIPRDLASI